MGASITLPDCKRAVTYDLHAITLAEWQAMFEPDHPFEEEQLVMEHVTGISVAEQRELTLYDHKLLWREFRRVVAEPLSDPN